MEEIDGTFLVTHADEASVVLRNVDSGQVHTLEDNPGVTVGEVIEGTLAPMPPLEVAWRLVGIDARRQITVEKSDEPPTRQAIELAADQPVGELARQERAGTGELHVLTVPEGEAATAAAVADVVGDEATLERAARLGVDRVEVRAESGVLSVRYLP